MIVRTRHSSRTVATMSTANASSIESCVSSPSSEVVTAAIGRRRSAGHGPKYMYCLPSMTKASKPSFPAGMSQCPPSSAWAWAS